MQAPSTPEQLYSLPPEQFVAARGAAVKAAKGAGDAAGAKALAALRRPSVSAWLVNRLARERADLLEQLLELGPALAAAQASGSGVELRALGEQRRQLVEAVVGQAVADADRPLTPAVRGEVAATLEAALADAGSAHAVRSGLLVRALSFAGFGGVDLEGAVAARPSPAPPPADVRPDAGPDLGSAGRKEKVVAAERAALEAAGTLDDAVRRCEDLTRVRVDAEQAASAARVEVERLEAELRAAHDRGAEADAALAQAQRETDGAVEQVRSAQAAEATARAALDRLRRS